MRAGYSFFLRSFLAIGLFTFSNVSAQVDSCNKIVGIEGTECAYPRYSQDQSKILYQSNQSGKWQLFIMDINSGKQKAVMKDNFNNNFPDWNSDNSMIAFVSDRDGNEEIYLINADGTGLKRITEDAARDIHPYFSPDGKYLLFNSTRGNGSFDIYRYTISSGSTIRLTDTPENETCARFSPNMRQIVYLKNSESQDDIYVMNMKNFLSENITKTPTVQDGWPMFSVDGKWVYYSSMEKGTYSIYWVRTDGSGKQQISNAPEKEEHARVNVSSDGMSILYNKKHGDTIEIWRCTLIMKVEQEGGSE
jgi:TolB protein